MTTKRLNYFNGQFLKQEDFSDEQDYHLSMRRRHNTGVHKAGVVDGLAVTLTSAGISVDMGWAVDQDGREIILDAVTGKNHIARPYYVTCEYKEEPSDPQPQAETGIPGNRRVTESANIEVVAAGALPPANKLVLAEITEPSGGNLVVTDKRIFSGLVVPGAMTARGDLTVHGNLEVRGQTTLIQADQMRGNVVLGDEDTDTVTVEGTMLTGHSSGQLRIGSPVAVTGAAQFANTVSVTGPVQLANTLAVTGALSVGGAAQVTGNLTVQGNLEVQGQTTLIEADQMRGNVVLGDTDEDTVTVEGTILTGHSTGLLKIGSPVDVAGSIRTRTGHLITNNPNGALVLNAGPSDASNLAGIWFRKAATLGETAPSIDLMRITESGNVGIGTNNPATKLQVDGVISTTKIGSSGAEENYRVGNDVSLWDINVANTLGLRGLQNNAVATVQLGSGGGTISGANGNIGVGTTAPIAKLQVAGNVSAENLLNGLPFRIGAGSTPAGSTNWVIYSDSGIYVDVNTSSAGFTGTPLYITSLHGISSHWNTTGASSVYLPTSTGFRIYIRWADGSALIPATANSNGWHIQWVGIQIDAPAPQIGAPIRVGPAIAAGTGRTPPSR